MAGMTSTGERAPGTRPDGMVWVPGGTFRHGKVFGSPMGEPAHRYYAEWEFPDRDSFEAAAASDEFKATGKDAYTRGFPQPTVEFVSLG